MKTKDYIEDLIQKNLEGLNDYEPTEGHFERFEAKLKLQHKEKKLNLSIIWKVAAAVVFVLLATNQAFIYFSPKQQGLFVAKNNNAGMNNTAGITLASVSSEYKEVEFYYTNAINVGLNQWNELKSEGQISEEEQMMMDDELKEFENLQKVLQTDLKANPHDERVINAMLEYYQAKLSVINMIVSKLQEVQKLKADTNTELNL